MKPNTQADWQDRVRRVLALLAGSLDSPPDLEQAAAEAASSPWHFHRTFRALAGESFSAVLRRLRLERAAFQLKAGTSVIEAALAAGYDSPEAFCRVFTRNFGLNPSRLAGLPWWNGELPSPGNLHYRPSREPHWLVPSREDGLVPARLITLGPRRTASLSGRGDYWQLPGLWQDFSSRLEAAGRRILPGEALTVFGPGDHFQTALLLPEGEAPPPSTLQGSLPGGLYILYLHIGPSEAIGPYWDSRRARTQASGQWRQDTSRPSLEWYQNSPPAEAPELSLTFLCDPVVPAVR